MDVEVALGLLGYEQVAPCAHRVLAEQMSVEHWYKQLKAAPTPTTPALYSHQCHINRQYNYHRKLLWAAQVVHHEATGAPVTAKSPADIEAESARCREQEARLNALPARARKRFVGRTFAAIRRDPLYVA